MSLRDVADRLARVLDVVTSARACLDVAGDHLDDARTLFDDALSGSSSWDVQDVTRRYRDASDAMSDLVAALDAADDAVRACRARMTGHAVSPGPAATGAAGRQGQQSDSTGPAPVSSELVEQLRGQLPPPVEKNKGQKTHGRWVGPDGQIHEEVSGLDDKSEAATVYFEDEIKSRRIPSIVTHVEGKLAVHMRKNGIRSATLIVNNPPCDGPMGCKELLPVVLPDGYTLTVYGPNGFQYDYRGGATSRWVP